MKYISKAELAARENVCKGCCNANSYNGEINGEISCFHDLYPLTTDGKPCPYYRTEAWRDTVRSRIEKEGSEA